MLARFSVAYERFCRLLVAIFVVNVAILAHSDGSSRAGISSLVRGCAGYIPCVAAF